MKIFGKQGTTALPTAAFVALALAASGAQAQTAEVLTLDIEAQQAGSALMELASSSGAQIMVSEQAGAEVEVESLQGEFRLEEALAAMLTDTGLRYEFTSENVVLVQQDMQSEQLEEVEAAESAAAPEEEEEPLELDPQRVTGTRLPGGDPSARIYSFTAEEIARRGVSNLEDFFRTLPWAHSTLNTQTSNSATVHRDGQAWGGIFDGNGLGISAVNLRGMGWENTLVLLNGRRVAGTAGYEDDFVNLLNVPLSAIERVDVQLDGASAVYGADAIGGVVNFITRKNYRGLSATYRQEFSSTDADSTNANITGGYSWGTGSVTAIITHSTSEPITNAKTGWTSLDFRPLLGPDFDRRSTTTGQPGVACETDPRPPTRGSIPPFRCKVSRGVTLPEYPGARFSQEVYYQLPAGHSGVGATPDDFVRFTRTYGFAPGFGFVSIQEPAPVPLDELPPQNGIDGENTGVTLALEQYLTDDLRLFADINWSTNESYQEYDRIVGYPFIVPASNAYNPFGVPMNVRYATVYEGENGTMPAQSDWSENESRSIAAGFIWDINENHQLEIEANRTKSWRETEGFQVHTARGRSDTTAEAFYAALSSSDPAVAINVFGDGTAQGSSFDEFLTNGGDSYSGVNETRQYRMTLRGNLFDFWGAGPISYSIGGEYSQNIIYQAWYSGTFRTQFESDESGGPVDQLIGSTFDVGLERPSRDTSAYYGELAVPLIGPEMDVPAMHSLILTLQIRYDVRETEGTRDGLETDRIPGRHYYWDPFLGDFGSVASIGFGRTLDPSEIVTARVSDSSPRLGLQFKPTPNATWRASWRRSFKTPNWSDQFSPREPASWETRPFTSGSFRQYIDPHDPDGPTLITAAEGVISRSLRYLPDLEAEYSDNWSLGFEWSPAALPGLRWSVDWSVADFTNRIATSSQYIYDHTAEAFASDQIAVRNERGDLTEVHFRNVNIAASENETLNTRIEYAFDTPWGVFTPRVGFFRYLEDYRQFTEATAEISSLGTQYGSDEYEWQGSLSWTYGRWQADVWLYYTPGYVHPEASQCYHDFQNIEGTICKARGVDATFDVASLTTVDLTVTYRMDNGLMIRAGGRNVLDRGAPATIARGSSHWLPYDATRWDARGQVLFLELNWEM